MPTSFSGEGKKRDSGNEVVQVLISILFSRIVECFQSTDQRPWFLTETKGSVFSFTVECVCEAMFRSLFRPGSSLVIQKRFTIWTTISFFLTLDSQQPYIFLSFSRFMLHFNQCHINEITFILRSQHEARPDYARNLHCVTLNTRSDRHHYWKQSPVSPCWFFTSLHSIWRRRKWQFLIVKPTKCYFLGSLNKFQRLPHFQQFEVKLFQSWGS